MNYLKLTKDKLLVEDVSQIVVSPTCGAISLFVGTTRDNCDDKKVLSLEYEAYDAMALKILEDICNEIRNKWKTVENIAIYHRLGNVPVMEPSVIIAISSPHRKEAIQATEWCIDTLKKNVPIWKKETYENGQPEWKENEESPAIPKRKKLKLEIEQQELETSPVPPHLIQIKASNLEISKRIEKFIERKRNELNINNIAEFCNDQRDNEFTCARIDAILKKRKDSKGHLQVDNVLNTYQHRDQLNSDYLRKFIPGNGVEERLINLESQLSLTTCAPKNIYKRLKLLEDRMLKLESISPEYVQFWETNKGNAVTPGKKKVFSIAEIDEFIEELEKKL